MLRLWRCRLADNTLVVVPSDKGFLPASPGEPVWAELTPPPPPPLATGCRCCTLEGCRIRVSDRFTTSLRRFGKRQAGCPPEMTGAAFWTPGAGGEPSRAEAVFTGRERHAAGVRVPWAIPAAGANAPFPLHPHFRRTDGLPETGGLGGSAATADLANGAFGDIDGVRPSISLNTARNRACAVLMQATAKRPTKSFATQHRFVVDEECGGDLQYSGLRRGCGDPAELDG